jgi:hypothetical protein
MNEFGSLLYAAARDSLRGRNAEIFHMRYRFLYGGLDARPCSLDQIGERFNMPRARVRQVLSKCFTRIRWKASRHIKRGEPNAPCARLLIYLCTTLRTDQPPHAVRAYCRQFSTDDEWAAAHLILSIAMPSSDRRRGLLTSIKNLINTSAQIGSPFQTLPQTNVSVTI